jgi:hypothetical protein
LDIHKKKEEKLTSRLFIDSEHTGTKTISEIAVPQECLTFSSGAYVLELTIKILLLFCPLLFKQ